jgi:hypothetical protein
MGLFDETTDPQNGVQLTPAPGLDPLSAPNLGVPPALLQGALPPMGGPAPMARPTLPPVPQAPQAPGDIQKIISMALLGLAAGLGPRHGGAGVAAGVSAGQDANEADRRQQFKDQQVQYQQQQQESLRQQALADRESQIAAAAQQQREKNLQGALMSIQADVKKLPDKATYDQRIEGYANLLRGSGYRIDGNWLRQAVPYIAPSQKGKAQEALANLLKNPVNAQLLKDNPQALADGSIKFDANGDGIAEIIPVRKLMDMAETSVVTNDKGQPLALAPSTQGDNMQVALRSKLALFRATNNREPNPKEMDALVTEARTPPKAPKDELTTALQQSLLDERRAKAKNAASGGLTDEATDYAATQYRVTGVMPALGMGSAQARTAVINRAAEQTKAMNQTPVEAIQKQAAFKADSSALTQMRRMSSSAEAFETKALAQADIVDGLSAKVSRTNYPIINDALLAGRVRIQGDANTQMLFNALQTFTTEYAKIMEGSTGSAAGSSQGARDAAAHLISAGLSKGTLAQTLDLMRKEMRLTIQGYGATIDHITTRMGGQAAAPTPDMTVSGPKEGESRTVNGVSVTWKTVNGKTGWYK